MKLSQLTEVILPKVTYKVYYFRKSAIPLNTPEDMILKKTPDFTLETQASTPLQAKNFAPMKYYREVRGQRQVSPFDIERFHRTYQVIVRQVEKIQRPTKMVQGSLF